MTAVSIPCEEEIRPEAKVSELMISITTPEAMITGRKKIARTTVRPWNLALSTMAKNSDAMMTTGTVYSSEVSDATRFLVKSGSVWKR